MKKLIMKKGFTLIELMIVVAIIGILAAIAIPQFANLVAKSQEGRAKANLGTVRSALSIYYGDLEGWYPTDASSTTGITSLTAGGRYLQTFPLADLPKTSNNVGHVAIQTVVNLKDQDGGGWYYNNNPSALGAGSWGQILVSCQHQDLRAGIWSSY